MSELAGNLRRCCKQDTAVSNEVGEGYNANYGLIPEGHQWLLAVLRWPQARLQCASSVHVLRRPRLQLRALRKDCRQQLKGWARRLCCNILRWVASR
jgi:hypothetical protein